MSWITVLWMLMSMPAMPIYKEFHFENDFRIWRPLTAFGVHLEQPFSLLLLHNGPTVHPEMVSVRKVYILVNLWGLCADMGNIDARCCRVCRTMAESSLFFFN